MSCFVQLPNLPQNTDILLIGEKYAGLLQNSLQKLGISPIFVPDNPCVDSRLSGHVDLSVFHAGGERVYLAPYLKDNAFHKALAEMGADIIFPDVDQDKKYPRDAQLNACSVGKRFIYSPKVTALEIVNYFTGEKGSVCIPSRQGYAKCSICVIDDNSIITADSGIAKAAETSGLNVLRISAGFIDLPGFKYGFIGGSAFRISAHLIAFTGTLDNHPDKSAVLEFIHARGVEAVFLTDNTIFDIGSALPICEKQDRK